MFVVKKHVQTSKTIERKKNDGNKDKRNCKRAWYYRADV